MNSERWTKKTRTRRRGGRRQKASGQEMHTKEQSTGRKPRRAEGEDGAERRAAKDWGERSKAKEGQQTQEERERSAEERPRAEEETEGEGGRAG